MPGLARELRHHAVPEPGSEDGLQTLMGWIGDADLVLLGEATHGTHDFYSVRAEITKRLIAERGFGLVAVEGDWPDALRVHRFITGEGFDLTPAEALSGFERFPRWMWRNTVIRDFVRWLHAHNEGAYQQAGLFGIDVYSLQASMHSVLGYLEQYEPEAGRVARERYACFDGFGGEPQRYGFAASLGLTRSCEAAVIQQLVDLSHARERAAGTTKGGHEHFFAEQNARVVANAEAYYRATFEGGVQSWNVRDTHMADTVDTLRQHFGRAGKRARCVIWAHNSHLGDARATELAREGEVNLGQLLRERHPGETFSVGFSTYDGTVTAARHWEGPAERRTLRAALPDSHEAVFHAVGLPRFMLSLREPEVAKLVTEPRLQRAVGVVYRPETERRSHYYSAVLADQFDAMIHMDRTSALEPLDVPDRQPRPEQRSRPGPSV
jgi:erythromycin esterase-like protein